MKRSSRCLDMKLNLLVGKNNAITAIPADFTDIDMKTMFIEMLDDFANISGKDAPNLIMEKVASMSCKAAVKGNNHLSRPEIEALIDELLELDNPYNLSSWKTNDHFHDKI